LKKVHIAIVKTGDSAAQFKQTAERLTAACKHVKEMADLADEISSETQSLALKVATKAAGAGDRGREFAPIGDELKKMAERASAVGSAEILVNMLGMVRDVQNMGSGIHENMDGMGNAVKSTIGQFENLVRAFEGNKDQLSTIEAAMEELSGKNSVVHAQVTDSREISKEVEAILGDADKAATSMNRKTEVLLEAVSQFKIGNDGLEQKIATVAANRDFVQSKIAAMWARSINVFDRNYKPVPNTNPQKYHTAYGSHFDKELQFIFDKAAQELDAIYCVAIDANGYLATHHSRVSKPMTGNYETDIVYSRDRRMYTATETEIRRFKNTNPFLLQTYLRDTGEILNDISMPIYIDGKHWGCIVAGFQPQKLHTQRAATTGRATSLGS
jgi:methyl-accepting chemotaxis protein